MIIPYSTALSISKPPIITYLVVVICIVVFYFQITDGEELTKEIMYYPETWNPWTSITSSFAHADLPHIFYNLIFFLAFTPALEIVIRSSLRFILIILFIIFATGLAYSLSILLMNIEPLPTLGLSGVVMGMIGLSGYLIPKARIKVFFWYVYAGKFFYPQSWVVALFYIGGDIMTLFMAKDFNGINVISHVSGGLAGYFYGYYWLSDYKKEIKDEVISNETQQAHLVSYTPLIIFLIIIRGISSCHKILFNFKKECP